MLRDEGSVIRRIGTEVELTEEEAKLYLKILREGNVPKSKSRGLARLLSRGMIILAGDDSGYVPVHPRLAIAKSYRTYREKTIRELNERRMRVDRLILELIPLYDAATEKRLALKR